MESSVSVEFCNGEKPLVFSESHYYEIEHMIVNACQYLGIGPVSRHLFGLYSTSESLWYPPNKKLELSNGKVWTVQLKIRFRPSSIKYFVERTDCNTLNYYFHQARNDFLAGKIPELFNRNMQMHALGLVATDIIRYMLEQKLSPDSKKYNSRDFLPSELKRGHFGNFLQGPLQKAVNKGWKFSRQSPEFVKHLYLQQFLELVPDYGSERYNVLIDEGGKVYEVKVIVNPFHPEYPGIRIKLSKNKATCSHICSIEELCYISMRNDETVEISRHNGVPQYLKFPSKAEMHSFVSLLDGYYRLSEKWTFNLCKELTTTSLQILRAMKCHGPVSCDFACRKLEEKCNNEGGCYTMHENEYVYDEFCIHLWKGLGLNDSESQETFKVIRDPDHRDFYILEGWSASFPSIFQLLSYHSKHSDLNFVRCIPPSEYDKHNLLLCHKENEEKSTITRGDSSNAAQCIPHDAILPLDNTPDLYGKITIVYNGRLKQYSEYRDVAVKYLQKEVKAAYLQEFLSQCDKVLFWQHDAIISTVGMILTNPTALVMEWLPLGTLDHYLRMYKSDLGQVDLVEAAYHIARALWYLEEQQMCHGNIRCHNVLVAAHTENSFKVKLADPGIIVYSDADVHWIPPECYGDFAEASKSILADVFAFGTTLWEIFSFGRKPLQDMSTKQIKDWYLHGNSLPAPNDCDKEIRKLIYECWLVDQDSRKRPQAIVRDVNQILYEVYNSRRSHSYAVINPASIPVILDEAPPLPTTKPPKEPLLNRLKNVSKWPTAVTKNFSYNALSQSTLNTTSGQTAISYLTEDRDSSNVVASSFSFISENENDPMLFTNNINSSELNWLIDKEQLDIIGQIGEGFYGEVSKAHLIHPGDVVETVAVKRIRTRNRCSDNDLRREVEIMKTLVHKNIVQMKGLVEEPETMLVMEYVEEGSLLFYLQSYKEKRDKLDCTQLLNFALDVAEGMQYLEKQRIVHRDLAARNILVGSSSSLKISDFGLAQITQEDYYFGRTNRSLPIRWYAMESIIERKFSHKSDVWSYGVTLWEMFSYGDHPTYKSDDKVIDDNSLIQYLDEGNRLPMPIGCPAAVYVLMRNCWEKDSHTRPSFSSIISTLKELREEV